MGGTDAFFFTSALGLGLALAFVGSSFWRKAGAASWSVRNFVGIFRWASAVERVWRLKRRSDSCWSPKRPSCRASTGGSGSGCLGAGLVFEGGTIAFAEGAIVGRAVSVAFVGAGEGKGAGTTALGAAESGAVGVGVVVPKVGSDVLLPVGVGAADSSTAISKGCTGLTWWKG